ncbi:MAG: YncE family protein [Vicinamibacterales bacterium]
MRHASIAAGTLVIATLAVWSALAAAVASAPRMEIQGSAGYSVRLLSLPDNNTGDVSMDYITYDAATNTVWVPGGNTGAVDVVDVATGKVRQISGFATSSMQARGATRVLGPTGVSVGDGVVYIGNRGDSSVCAVDARTLARSTCGTLDSMPDGVAYVAPTHEVWVTTPRDTSIRILDAKTLKQKATLTFEGNPEGYAIDADRGRFYTNLEDKDRTLAIDLKTHQTVATWMPNCGEEGPHGLSLDAASGHLFLACSTLAEVLDVAHDGAVLSKVDTGNGVDDLHYSPYTHELYVGAAQAATLTIARADRKGQLSVVAKVPTHQGARNATVAKNGAIYLAHSRAKLPALVVVTPPRKG